MRANTVDTDQLRTSYAVLRTRLLAKRKLEEAKLARARDAIRRIDRELAALDRERMQLDRHKASTAAATEDVARAARRFASTATR